MDMLDLQDGGLDRIGDQAGIVMDAIARDERWGAAFSCFHGLRIPIGEPSRVAYDTTSMTTR